jgi:hypothetical protein
MAPAVIITFHTKTSEFDSDYERNKFFKNLYGWKQVVPKEHKKYFYRRKGILDEVPHTKIADSVFMIAQKNLQQVQEFFDEWEKKVDYDIMKVMVEQQKLRRMLFEENI